MFYALSIFFYLIFVGKVKAKNKAGKEAGR